MEIKGDLYKHFLETVRGLYEAELKREGSTPKPRKINYWLEVNGKKDFIIYNLNLGTGEIRHFYLQENKLEKNPNSVIEEREKVIIAVLNKIGYELSKETEEKIKFLPIKQKNKVEATELWEQFIVDRLRDSKISNNISAPKTLGIFNEINVVENESSLVNQFKKFIISFFGILEQGQFETSFSLWESRSKRTFWNNNLENYLSKFYPNDGYNNLHVFNVKDETDEYSKCHVLSARVYFSQVLQISQKELFKKIDWIAFDDPHRFLDEMELLYYPNNSLDIRGYSILCRIVDKYIPKSWLDVPANRKSKKKLLKELQEELLALEDVILEYSIEKLYHVIGHFYPVQNKWLLKKAIDKSKICEVLAEPFGNYIDEKFPSCG
ncbi:hypothetical protein SAMN04488511_11411 [Pedobacter suwonensis]|uniref:Uncharacterized protein n=1 Tax=Pedobacter suwonensis TaxID=332999 RepID=A0A1I0TSW5_9SPHI|nr:hypothetical protein [Pedobacter suwonensis]SFA54787.1 hypothetical protein SAMN04488511_11411 [Pedobacter suwonensis]